MNAAVNDRANRRLRESVSVAVQTSSEQKLETRNRKIFVKFPVTYIYISSRLFDKSARSCPFSQGALRLNKTQ